MQIVGMNFQIRSKNYRKDFLSHMQEFKDILPLTDKQQTDIQQLSPYFMKHDITLENALFFDIETTGLAADYCSVYIIGCIHIGEHDCHRTIYFADTPDDEQQLLVMFFEQTKKFKHLIHFNGEGFDIPFLTKRSTGYDIDCPLTNMDSFDIFKKIRPFKAILQLENAKQKSLELFLGIEREDIYTGGELIQVYKDYVKQPTDDARKLLLQHNLDDLEGMVLLLPILLYPYLFEQIPDIINIHTNKYPSLSGEIQTELLIEAAIPLDIPKPFSYQKNGFYLNVNKDILTIRCHVFEGELKHFYDNYQDYYYLPMEDTAIHKSVAEFVDKSYRKKATKSSCYTRHSGSFIHQPAEICQPVYKSDVKTKQFYFPLEKIQEDDTQVAFAKSVLEYLKP